MPKQFKEIPVVRSSKRQSKPQSVEVGDMVWDAKDAEKRKKILEEIGLEYNQINLLAQVLVEVIKEAPALQDNTIVQEAMGKFNRINEIRNED